MTYTILRRPDWRSRLFDYVNKVRREPFQEGSLDCALFVAGAVEALTGIDLAKNLRGRYRTLSVGLRQIQKSGYIDHVDIVRANFSEIPVAEASLGDIAVVEGENGIDALGIVQGAMIFVVGREGLQAVDLLQAKGAFRV